MWATPSAFISGALPEQLGKSVLRLRRSNWKRNMNSARTWHILITGVIVWSGAIHAAQNPIARSPEWGRAIEDYIEQFVGVAPADCGLFSFRISDQERHQTLDCALAAAGRHQPFQTSVEPIDVQGGLIGNADGTIYNFTAFPCRSGNCPPTFAIKRCPSAFLDGQTLLCGISDSPLPAQRPDEYVHALTGPSATDCGQHQIPATELDLRKSLDCATQAAQALKPFQTIKQIQGIDSLVYGGLLGDMKGRIYLFGYDSAPCGNPRCYGRFSVRQCASPTVTTGPTRFACAP